MDLYHGYIYSYYDNDQQEIAIYMCDTNLSSNVCIIPLKDDDQTGRGIPIIGINKLAYPLEFKEIKRNQIKNNLRIKGKTIKVDYITFLNLSEIMFHLLLDKTYKTYERLSQDRLKNIDVQNYSLTEDYYKYLTWFDYKTKLQFEKTINRNPGVIKGSLYYAELGENIGSELHKLRPVVIFKKCVSAKPEDSSYIVIPITSKSSSGKYAFNPPIIVNGKINYVRINDLRRISVKRLACPLLDHSTRKTIVLSLQDMETIKQKLKEYFIDEKQI